MNVVFAPDKFKGTLAAAEVARLMAMGWRFERPDDELRLAPMADGGNGTVQVLSDVVAGARAQVTDTVDAFGRPRPASWVLLPDGRAVVEVATAVGMDLLDPSELDPIRATSAGVGHLLLAARRAGAHEILVGLGGSATIDGGAGAASVLGHHAFTSDGHRIEVGRDDLGRIDRLQLGPVFGPRVVVLADVNNPLLGPDGATQVYGRQKGAKPEQLPSLERSLTRYADAVEAAGYGSWRDLPGAGAAGGLGFVLIALLGATVKPGAEAVAELVGLDAALADADLAITGEGRLDRQTAFGKAPDLVRRRARAGGLPVYAVAGAIDQDAGAMYDQVLELGPEGMERAGELVTQRAAQLARAVGQEGVDPRPPAGVDGTAL